MARFANSNPVANSTLATIFKTRKVRSADLDHKIAAPISNVSFSGAVVHHDFTA